MTGRVLTEATRTKMSESHGGVGAYIYNNTLHRIEVYPTLTLACATIGCSLRTFSR